MPKRITVTNTPRQSVEFNVDNIARTVTLAWNTVAGSWFLDYSENGSPVVSGIRMFPLVNLLHGVDTDGFIIAVNMTGNAQSNITFDALTSGNTRLFFYTVDEAKQLIEQ